MLVNKLHKKRPMENLYEKTVEYIETRAELLKLKAMDKGANALSKTVSALVSFILLILVIVLVSIAVSIWVGELLGNVYLGFFAMAGFYLLLFILLMVVGKSTIEKGIKTKFTKSILN
jgi:Putative Actinobacterial Holin-X, holin superfamily III